MMLSLGASPITLMLVWRDLVKLSANLRYGNEYIASNYILLIMAGRIVVAIGDVVNFEKIIFSTTAW